MRRRFVAVPLGMVMVASYACVGEDPRPTSTTIIINNFDAGGAADGGPDGPGGRDGSDGLEAGTITDGGRGVFDGGPRALIAFVTSEDIPATSIGDDLVGADGFCNDLASAPGSKVPTAHAPFVAWLSDTPNRDTRPAWKRLPLNGEWVNVENEPVATNAKLQASTLDGPLVLDERGATQFGMQIWTGTRKDGSHAAGFDCNGWSGDGTGNALLGVSGARDGSWTESATTVCLGNPHRLYCFETAP